MIEPASTFVDLASWLSMLERIVEESSNMVVVTDAYQRVTWVNQTYTHVTGWTLEEVRGSPAGRHTHGILTDKRVTALLSSSLRQGQSVSGVELVNYRKSGEPYTVLLNIEPIRDAKRDIVAYFSIQSDVTEKRKLEKTNAQLQYHLQAAQALLKLGVVRVDREKKALHWSPEVNEIFELDSASAGGRLSDLIAFMSPADQEALRKKVGESITAGQAFDQEFPIITAKGNRRWVRFCGAPEREQHAWRSPDTWTIQDISIYKELIEQKHLNNERLHHMVSERTRRLEEANRSLEAFSHALSHDLKKPLRHMVSYAEIVKDAIASDDKSAARNYCEKVVAAGSRLSSLVDGMLAFSRLGRKGLACSSVDMKPLVIECLSETAASFPSQAYSVSGLESLPTVWADPTLMREVWSNLLDNAFKYSCMCAATRLQFATQEAFDGWTLSVSDNGRGIDPAHTASVFEMFFRTAHDTAIGGDGIGLAMCKRIVESHGGRIWAEAAPEGGTTIFVHLPRASAVSSFGTL